MAAATACVLLVCLCRRFAGRLATATLRGVFSWMWGFVTAVCVLLLLQHQQHQQSLRQLPDAVALSELVVVVPTHSGNHALLQLAKETWLANVDTVFCSDKASAGLVEPDLVFPDQHDVGNSDGDARFLPCLAAAVQQHAQGKK